MSTYTLQVPATNYTIEQLICKICEETANDPNARVTLKTKAAIEALALVKYGTCRLMCSDEAERREFGSRVTMFEAVSVLWSSRQEKV
jgi:hypothetical protein